MATKSAPKNGATAPVENIAPVSAPQVAPTPIPAPASKAAPRRVVKAVKAPEPAKTAKPRAVAPKAVAPKAVAARRTTKPKSKTKKSNYSLDDIALRAYFISEDRHARGIHGSPENDWIEAERQLRAEASL